MIIPVEWQKCATCSHWCGIALPDVFYRLVSVDALEKGKCINGGFHLLKMSPLATCPEWKQRFKK